VAIDKQKLTAMNTVYIQLGSNIGNSKAHLQQAQQIIEQQIGQIIKLSSYYNTAAWGNTKQADFLNQIILTETNLTAAKLIAQTLKIEAEMGRTRSIKNAARIIDIDILFFNNEIIESKMLTIPHPEIQHRRFVLVPLAEIAASFVHPTLQKTVKTLLNECTDGLNVQKI
jgi:2-amino-4-hydroxy-6-hydroxymethyldihydropteridine diphosphokinase